MKSNLLISILILYSLSMSVENQIKNRNFKYDGNGRIILPGKSVIEKLPQDGGELFNRLIFESSPYLLQHAANPVDWYPWGEDAFSEALRRDVPIFLSIGYSTCHWCHVMEHESFEDVEVAKLMNESFVNVKVDREERPDIDKLYMDVTQMVTGRGGWPMTVIMTPDKEPFFAGTYFPKHGRYNRQGLMQLIPKIKEIWETQRDDILKDAKQLSQRLISNYESNRNQDVININILEEAFTQLSEKFDAKWGGFGNAPKFPKAHDYVFLLKYWKKNGNQFALNMVEKSLTEMRKGGIYDHIGFGFHRYSVDEKWLAPHFEKMLYDQAILIMAYSEAWHATGKYEYRKVVEEIIHYITRDMTSETGGFYSAEDADSEGEEGTFYLWTNDEIIRLLGEKEGNEFLKLYNFESGGNWPEGKQHGQTNIPHFRDSIFETAENFNLDSLQLLNRLDLWREHLFSIRKNRIHPLKDDKILTDWNGLMITALAISGRDLKNSSYIQLAETAMTFILNEMQNPDGSLKKRYRNGNSGLTAVLDDYAFVIWALIELYQSTYKLNYLENAIQLMEYQLQHFWDKDGNGFYFSADIGEKLLSRPKEYYDGATPSGNSVSAFNLVRLSRILSKPDYEEIANQIIESNAKSINRYPSGYSMLLQAIQFMNDSKEILIFEGSNNIENQNMINSIQEIYYPNKVVVLLNPKNFSEAKSLMPYLNHYQLNENVKPLVYVCENYICKLPTSDVKVVQNLLIQ